MTIESYEEDINTLLGYLRDLCLQLDTSYSLFIDTVCFTFTVGRKGRCPLIEISATGKIPSGKKVEVKSFIREHVRRFLSDIPKMQIYIRIKK